MGFEETPLLQRPDDINAVDFAHLRLECLRDARTELCAHGDFTAWDARRLCNELLEERLKTMAA